MRLNDRERWLREQREAKLAEIAEGAVTKPVTAFVTPSVTPSHPVTECVTVCSRCVELEEEVRRLTRLLAEREPMSAAERMRRMRARRKEG
jgi:hypothetical protein